MKKYLFILAILLPFVAIAQIPKKCAQVAHTQKIRATQPQPLVSNTYESNKEIPCDSMIIPVAVHFMETIASRACLERIVAEQIASLNADFSATNADLGKYDLVAQYFNIAPNASCLKFEIADNNHPSLSGLQDGQSAITINQLKNETDWAYMWSDYFNIFVFEIGDNILGYSPLGGTGKGDGVVIGKFAFGGRGACGDISTATSLDRGRTLTHEVGHYFGLPHIWGNRDGCNQDDGFRDTPYSDAPNFECFSPNQKSCGTHDMSMNYMDYTPDDCMYMFSPQQGNRMELYLQIHLAHLVSKGKEVIGALSEETPVDVPVDSTNTTEDTDDDNSAPKPNIFTTLILVILGIGSWIYTAIKGE